MLLLCILLYGASSLYWFYRFVYRGRISFTRPSSWVGALMAALLWPLGAIYLVYEMKR